MTACMTDMRRRWNFDVLRHSRGTTDRCSSYVFANLSLHASLRQSRKPLLISIEVKLKKADFEAGPEVRLVYD